MVYEVKLKIYHNCNLTRLAESLDQNYFVNCNGRVDQLTFTRELDITAKEMLLDILNYHLVIPIYSGLNDQNHHVLLFQCDPRDKSHFLHFYNHIISEFGMIFGLPKITKDYEEYIYTAFDSTIHKEILGRLQKVTNIDILSVKEYPFDDFFGNFTFSLADLVENLTEYQMQLLFEAYANGYYSNPREIRLADLAIKYRKSRYAIEKSLRKAENKLIDFVFPFIL